MQATLLPGDRLGPYEITSRIGAGGMGEVYRARDTRLHRTVAIKVLKQELIGDAASRERFEREAQAIAALEHPGICTLHDVGEHGDTRFLVMAFVEGEALAALLDQGPLPINRVTQYAFELANALDAAHRAGIVHRDLKPGNVMVTKNGVILLDFGLARLASTEALRIDSATTLAISEPGILIGTLAYMAPEQVEGKQSDHRADIFALGAVIFEMATGRRPFESDNPARLMAAILNTEPPPISTMRSDWPQSLDWAVSKCLAKNPDDRWHSTRDFSDHLKWALANVPAGRHATEPRNDKRRAWTVIPLLSAAVIAALAALWVTSRPETRSLPLAQFSIDLPDGVRLAPEPASPTLAFSPDGEHLYFSALKDGDQQIFARAINALDVRAVTGTEGGGNPFVSPDGKWLGFTARGLLNKIPVGGGSAVSITATPDLTGASWNAANEIALAPSNRSGLVKVSDKGGATSPLTNLGGSVPGTSHRFPEFLPGGRAVLFTAGPPASGGWYDADVFAQPLSAGDPQVVIQGAAQAHYARSGHLVYARAGSLYAVPFDARALKVTGKAVAVLKGVSEDQGSGDAQYTISESGSLAYVPGGLRRNEVLRVDRSGRVEPLITDSEPRLFRQPRFSPDGKQIAISVASGNDDVWVFDASTRVLTRVTSGANHLYPTWSSDGRRLSFYQSDTRTILAQPIDRSEAPALLFKEGESPATPHSWSPDGSVLLVTMRTASSGSDVFSVRVADGHLQPVVQSAFADLAPALSPDGRWIAYSSDETGRLEIYVRPFPGPGPRTLVSRSGGVEPLWAPNGRELFFREPADRLMAVAITNGVTTGAPQKLFELPRWTAQTFRTNYDVSPDGQSFVMIRSLAVDPATQRIRVVLNWTDSLKRLFVDAPQ